MSHNWYLLDNGAVRGRRISGGPALVLDERPFYFCNQSYYLILLFTLPLIILRALIPIAYLNALFRIPSMVVSCLSLKTPRCVAWYLDLSYCSIAGDLSGGLSFRFARALASFLRP